jgi:cytochrome bd-type quinol oxidase subunit 2
MPIINPVINPDLGATTDGGSAIANLMARLFQAIVMMGGLAVILFLAWGGFAWLTAGGDKDKVEQAKSRITNAIIGMAVIMATIAVAIFLESVFGYNLLDPTINVSSSP